jgi:uncharacterized protein
MTKLFDLKNGLTVFYYKNLINYFLIAYCISWVIWMPLYLPYFGYKELPILPYHHAYGALGPIIAGFIMEKKERGTEGVLALLKSMVKWRVDIIWYGVVLLPIVLLLIAMFWESYWYQKPMDFKGMFISKEFPEFSALGFLFYNLFTFGVGEETGWRGYALPHLQAHYPAFTATILLTIGWAVWHIPAFYYRPDYVSMGIGEIVGWLLSLFTGSILLTWLFNSTKGSVFMCILFHTAINNVFTNNVTLDKTIVQNMGIGVTVWAILVVVFTRPLNLSFLKRVKNSSL